MRNIAVWMAALALAAFAANGEPQAATATKRPAASSAKPAAAVKLTDAQLEALIRAKFAKSKIHEDKFTVRVQGGVAHIDGKTDVLQHKGVATRMSRTAGAVGVDNRIQVSDAAKEKAAGNLEQGRRRVQVKRSEPRGEDR